MMNEIPNLLSSGVLLSLLTLTFLEIVLGVDNIIFISITAARLEEKERKRATRTGLIVAMGLRILLLFGLTLLTAMQATLFSFHTEFVEGAFSIQSLILIVGGLFLIYKSVTEIHHKLESPDEIITQTKKPLLSLRQAIIQITLINIIFSLDSILTAVGMTNGMQGALWIMILAVVFSVLIMILFAHPVGKFVNEHPTIQMLGLSFLILIGFALIAEGAHIAHFSVGGESIGSIPKGYLYFAIAFSLLVEVLNIRSRKRKKPLQLHGIGEDAKEVGYYKKQS
jgi:predicted tellurium resistance membrane protein TerC